MKTIVVYYSLSGNVKWIAEHIAKSLDATLCALVPERPYPKARWLQMVICGQAAVSGRKPKLANPPIDLSGYDNILLGAPVWAGTFAAPVNTFLHEHSFAGKNVALFASSGGGETDKCFSKMKAALEGARLVGECSFQSPLEKDRDAQADKAISWAKDLPLGQ